MLFLWILLIMLSSSSCNKEKKEAKHRDVVTAVVNGQPWNAGCEESPPFGCNIADLQYYPETGGFELTFSNVQLDTSFGIRLSKIINTGIFKMQDKTSCATLDKGVPCNWQRHYINDSDPQEIEIMYIDEQNKVIEGRFHFIGHDTICGSEPVHVTAGYFKVRYRP